MSNALKVSIAATVLLVACGGGGSGGDVGGAGTGTGTGAGTGTSVPTPAGNAAFALQDSVSSPAYVDRTPQARILEQLNMARRYGGAGTLASNASLDAAASKHLAYLTANWTGQFSHSETKGVPTFTGESPSDRAAAAGYVGPAGEVIAAGDTPAACIGTLLNTVYHLEGLMAGARDVGVAFGPLTGTTTNACVLNLGYPANGRQLPAAGTVITYPYSGQTGVATAFGPSQETPAPVPTAPADALAGSLIMASMASQAIIQPGGPVVTVDKFLLKDAAGVSVATQLFISPKATNKTAQPSVIDANVGSTSAFLLPDVPLPSGATFSAEFQGSVNGVAHSKTWKFTTRNALYVDTGISAGHINATSFQPLALGDDNPRFRQTKMTATLKAGGATFDLVPTVSDATQFMVPAVLSAATGTVDLLSDGKPVRTYSVSLSPRDFGNLAPGAVSQASIAAAIGNATSARKAVMQISPQSSRISKINESLARLQAIQSLVKAAMAGSPTSLGQDSSGKPLLLDVNGLRLLDQVFGTLSAELDIAQSRSTILSSRQVALHANRLGFLQPSTSYNCHPPSAPADAVAFCVNTIKVAEAEATSAYINGIADIANSILLGAQLTGAVTGAVVIGPELLIALAGGLTVAVITDSLIMIDIKREAAGYGAGQNFDSCEEYGRIASAVASQALQLSGVFDKLISKLKLAAPVNFIPSLKLAEKVADLQKTVAEKVAEAGLDGGISTICKKKELADEPKVITLPASSCPLACFDGEYVFATAGKNWTVESQSITFTGSSSITLATKPGAACVLDHVSPINQQYTGESGVVGSSLQGHKAIFPSLGWNNSFPNFGAPTNAMLLGRVGSTTYPTCPYGDTWSTSFSVVFKNTVSGDRVTLTPGATVPLLRMP